METDHHDISAQLMMIIAQDAMLESMWEDEQSFCQILWILNLMIIWELDTSECDTIWYNMVQYQM